MIFNNAVFSISKGDTLPTILCGSISRCSVCNIVSLKIKPVKRAYFNNNMLNNR